MLGSLFVIANVPTRSLHREWCSLPARCFEENHEKTSFIAWKYRPLGGSCRCQRRTQSTSLSRRRSRSDLSSGRMRVQPITDNAGVNSSTLFLKTGWATDYPPNQPDHAWPDTSIGADMGVCPFPSAVVCLSAVPA